MRELKKLVDEHWSLPDGAIAHVFNHGKSVITLPADFTEWRRDADNVQNQRKRHCDADQPKQYFLKTIQFHFITCVYYTVIDPELQSNNPCARKLKY